MGIRLIVEVLDYAPADLTWRERHALTVLAENANDATRECWPGIEDDPAIAHRMRLPARSSRYEVMKALREKKALEGVTAGHRGHRAVYRIPAMGPAKGPGTPDATDEKGSGNDLERVREPRTLRTRKGPGTPDATDEKGSGNDLERVREPHGKGPGTPDPFPSTPSTPSRDSLSPDGETSDTGSAPDGQQQGDGLAAFGAFWLVYPKRKAKQDALKAWKAAVKDGADPQRIIAGATAYARERANQDPRYTKHPANWLRDGCYDDEPDPVPVRNGFGPQTAPHDLSSLTDEEIADALRF